VNKQLSESVARKFEVSAFGSVATRVGKTGNISKACARTHSPDRGHLRSDRPFSKGGPPLRLAASEGKDEEDFVSVPASVLALARPAPGCVARFGDLQHLKIAGRKPVEAAVPRGSTRVPRCV
jgi:hypothetical protein